MAESDKERRDREKREKKERDAKDWQAIQDRQNQINEDRRQKAINAAAAREEQERLEDEFLDSEFLKEFEMDAKAARDYLQAARMGDLTDKEVQDAIDAVKAADKAMEGGIIFGPNPDKAKKIIKKNRGKIKNSIAKGKKKKGGWCSLILIGLLGAGGGVLYGMYEGVSAIASMIF